MMEKGRLIAIEGIDGAGTTTQARLLGEKLVRMGRDAVVTAEPTDNPVGRLIRRALRGELDLQRDAIALIFAADRVEHYLREISPALDAGKWVVSDRYVMSSLAYQTLDCDAGWVSEMNSRIPRPALTIVIDTDVETALKRKSADDSKRDIFEKKDILVKVRKNYLELSKRSDLGKIHLIDGNRSIEEVHSDITRFVSDSES